jgi:hypothetical protein
LRRWAESANTELTAFTDGCPSLRSILADAGVMNLPILDWFYIAMRLQLAKQAAIGLSTDEPGRMQAKTAIVAEVERLRWRIWKGKAKNARLTIERIRKVMHVFTGERGHHTRGVPSRKLRRALHEVDNYLSGQSTWLVNYAKRYRAGLRVGTSVTEGTANFLVNRRMNKSQQMRWSRRGADLLLQLGCAVYNGALSSGLANCSNLSPTHGRHWPRRHDPSPNLWTLPRATVRKIGRSRLVPRRSTRAPSRSKVVLAFAQRVL